MNWYYLVSVKWQSITDLTWVFWRVMGNGYTINLEEAGLFSGASKDYPVVWNSKDIDDALTSGCIAFYIHQDIVAILGNKITCITR